MTRTLLLFILIHCAACSENKSEPEAETAVRVAETIAKREQLKVEMPHQGKAHPAARKLLQADWLYSAKDDHAPFGSDDAADAYAAFSDWRKTHTGGSTKKFVTDLLLSWQYPAFDHKATDYNSLRNYIEGNTLGWRYLFGTDAAIIATAFGQLYIEGRVDSDLKQMAVTALKRESTHEFIQSWQEERPEREEKLNKLLAILEKAP